MDEFKWIEDIDCISSDVDLCVGSKWHTKRLNRKFKKIVTRWTHPKDMVKIKRVWGTIDREFMGNRWLFLTFYTSVGELRIFSEFVSLGEEGYYVEFYDKNNKIIKTDTVTRDFTPQMLVEQLNKLGDE